MAHPGFKTINTYTLWHARAWKLLAATHFGTPELQSYSQLKKLWYTRASAFCQIHVFVAHPSLTNYDKHKQSQYLIKTGQTNTNKLSTMFKLFKNTFKYWKFEPLKSKQQLNNKLINTNSNDLAVVLTFASIWKCMLYIC